MATLITFAQTNSARIYKKSTFDAELPTYAPMSDESSRFDVQTDATKSTKIMLILRRINLNSG